MRQTFKIQTDLGNDEFDVAEYKDITNYELKEGMLVLYKVGSTFGINLKHVIDFKAVRHS